MSWLKQLAVKAEAALEKIDSEAATILKKDKVKYHPSQSNLEHKRSSSYNVLSAEKLSTSATESRGWSLSAHNSVNSSPKDLKSRKRNTDSNSQKNPIKVLHSRQSSSSSFSSSVMPGSERESPGLDIDTSVDSGHVGSFVSVEVRQNRFRGSASSSLSTSYSDGHNAHDTYFAPSSVSECELLRKEVVSLSQEMQQVLRRAKEAEGDNERIRGELSAIMAERTQYEVLMRQNQQESSRKGVSKAEGTETSLLHVPEQRTTSNENLRLLTADNRIFGIDSEELNALKERFDDANYILQQEKTSSSKIKEQFTTRIREMEDSHRMLTDELSICQQRFQSAKHTSNTYSQQILNLKSELAESERKFDEYKAKAGRILEAKEKLFDSLKEEGIGSVPDDLLQQEIVQLKNERAFLQEELQNSGKIIHGLKLEIIEVELAAAKEHSSNLSQLDLVEKDISLRQDELLVAKEQKIRAEQEMCSIQEEFTKVKNTLAKRIEVRDREIDKLQNQIAHKISSSVGISELENRIHSLTEALILKQNNVESLSVERHTLNIKCEKLQEQYLEAQKLLNTDVKIYVEEDRHHQSSFMTESPFDGGVTRRVKKAYGSVDKVSIRLGTFLRRYPTARLFILMYIGLLHLWVMIVLFTYTPETHAIDFNG